MNPTLTLVNPATGEVVEDDPRAEEIMSLRAEVEELKAAIVHESRVNSNLRSQISRMKGEQIREASLDPLAATAQRLCEAWKLLCNHGRCVIDDGRLKAPLEALKRRQQQGMDMDEAEAELRKPLFGAAAFPYVTGQGRSREGTPRERHDDLTLIYRSEEKIRAFSSLAQDEAERILSAMVKPLVHTYGRDVQAGHDPWSNEITHWSSPCPVCETGVPRLELRVAFSESLELVELRCSTGCEPKQVRARLREMWAEQRQAA